MIAVCGRNPMERNHRTGPMQKSAYDPRIR
jgi:hypothetical protein